MKQISSPNTGSRSQISWEEFMGLFMAPQKTGAEYFQSLRNSLSRLGEMNSSDIVPQLTSLLMAPQIDGNYFISLCDELEELNEKSSVSFDEAVLKSPFFYQHLFLFCRSRIPKEQLYQTTLDAYYRFGFDFPRQTILDITDLRPDDYLKDLPEQYQSCDMLPVIRVSKTPPSLIQNVADELSWTTCYGFVKRMCDKKAKHKKQYLYFGIIDKRDIIGCPCSREDAFEIIQYGSVENLIPVHYSYLLQKPKGCVTSLDDYVEIKEYNDMINAKLQRIGG